MGRESKKEGERGGGKQTEKETEADRHSYIDRQTKQEINS